MRGTYQTPTQLLEISLAGPLVNLTLYGIFSVIAGTFNSIGGLFPLIVNQLKDINLTLGLFNLIPVLPLDGGQILKALVWKQTGQLTKGSRYVAWTGYIIGITAIVGSISVYAQKHFLEFGCFTSVYMLVGVILLINLKQKHVVQRK